MLPRILAAATALALLACAPASAASKDASPPARLTAAFGPGARLGGEASVRVGLRIDSRRLPSPITEVRVLTPLGLDIAASQLGLANCQRPEADFTRVVVEGPTRDACPANGLLGTGTATAELRLSGAPAPIEGLATIRLFSAASRNARPGLVLVVDTSNPVSTQLVYAGQLLPAPAPFGVGIVLRIPEIPSPPLGAVVALAGLQMTIGGPEVIYSRTERGRLIHYRPGGLTLPTRCPRGGLRFRLQLRFADGTRRTDDAALPCPRGRRRV